MAMKKPQLVIKPFKSQPKVREDFEEITWKLLLECLNCIHHHLPMKDAVSKETLYRCVEDLCIQKKHVETYNKLQQELVRIISSKIDVLVDEAIPTLAVGSVDSYLKYLDKVDQVWDDYCQFNGTIRNVFLHLDRTYALQTIGVKSLYELGIDIYRAHLESRWDSIESKIILGLLTSIEADRNGYAVDKLLIKKMLMMLSALGLYNRRFEGPFLTDSVRYYSDEGISRIETLDVSGFLLHVENRLKEVHQPNQYLDVNTRPSLVKIIENNLLVPHTTALIEKGLHNFIDENKVNDLRRMFTLFDRVGQSETIKSYWINYVKRRGKTILRLDLPVDASSSAVPAAGAANTEGNENDMIEELLKLFDDMDNIWKNCFSSNDAYKSALKSAFEHVINIKPNMPAEYLSKYMDKKLRGEKGVDDAQNETILAKSLTVFRYLLSKDTFEAFYKKHLAKRLLLFKSASNELERSMIAKLKAECGANYTTKLEGMLQDIELSRDIMNAYTTSSSPRGRSGEPEMVVQVLTTGFWPSYSTDADRLLILPPILVPLIDRFNSFYTSKYQGRRLLWLHSIERLIITAQFAKGKKELDVSFLQGLVLLCFNHHNRLSYSEIKAYTGIPDVSGELKRTLQSLACGPVALRVLTKEPKGKDIEESDVFLFNQDYVNKQFRIKILTIQAKDVVEEEDTRTHEEVFRDRQYLVDAVVVRTMKTRKILSHNDLISELTNQLKFPVSITDLKKRIESLIEREYLERNRDDPSVYNYLA